MECVKVVSLSLIRLALNVHRYGTDTVWRRTCIIHQHRNSASVARGHSIVSMGVLMGPSKPGGNIFSHGVASHPAMGPGGTRISRVDSAPVRIRIPRSPSL